MLGRLHATLNEMVSNDTDQNRVIEERLGEIMSTLHELTANTERLSLELPKVTQEGASMSNDIQVLKTRLDAQGGNAKKGKARAKKSSTENTSVTSARRPQTRSCRPNLVEMQ